MNGPCTEVVVDPRGLDAVVRLTTDVAEVAAALADEGHPAAGWLAAALDRMDAGG